MKRFIRTIILSIIFLFLINGVLDVYVSNSLQHSKGSLYITWNEIINSKINADLLIIGHSRASWQYNPHILDSILHINSYVLGFNGSAYDRQIVKYNIYNHYQTGRPRYIVVNVDYIDNFIESKSSIEREQLFPFMTNAFIRRQFLSVDSFSFAEKYLPIYRYTTQKGVLALLNRDGRVVDNTVKGYSPRDLRRNLPVSDAMPIWHFKVDDSIVQMFDKFLYERTSENIRIIFCYAPIYIGLTKKVDNIEEMYNTYQSIAGKYNIPILDYMYSSISQDSMNFYDGTHLNKHGSDLFTIQLAHDLDSLVFF